MRRRTADLLLLIACGIALRSAVAFAQNDPTDVARKGVGSRLPERPGGCFAQTTPDPFSLGEHSLWDEKKTAERARQDSVPDIEQMIRDATAPAAVSGQPALSSQPASSTPDNAPASPPWGSHVEQLLIYPFLACLVLTGIHCYLGIHVIARGVIFVDLALAQMAALGGIVALLAGLDPHGTEAYAFSLSATLLGAALFATGRLKRQLVPQEAIIGIIYAVSSALALLLLSKAPSEQAEETKHMLVGRILFVSKTEVWKTAALYAGVGLFHWIFRRRFLVISLHPDLTQEQGIAVRWWDFLFYTSFGVVVTSSVQMAGVLLVFSFLIVPAVCATLLARNVGTRLVIGWAIGFVASVLGLYFSVQFDLPPGESVVTTFGGLLVVVALVRGFLPHRAV
jgi:zinc/manganese transport system permease protein